MKTFIAIISVMCIGLAVYYFAFPELSVLFKKIYPSQSVEESAKIFSPPKDETATSSSEKFTGEVVKVSIKDYAFSPNEVTVTPGSKVVWLNEDLAAHKIVSDDGIFEGPVLSQGGSFEYVFEEIGVYSYHCAVHPSMTAIIVVE